MNKTPSPNSDDFNDPLERNMKKLFAPIDDAGHDHPTGPRLGADEKEAMFAQITDKRFRRPGGWFLFFCVSLGILMPLGVVIYEWISQAADWQLLNLREIFYNPIPTFGHVILCALVPIVNLLLLLHLRQKIRLPRALRSMMVGGSLAISLFYIAVLVPMLHVIGIGLLFIVIGIGLLALLPLSPHFGALFTVLLSRRIGRVEQGIKAPLAFAGFAVALLMLGGFTTFHQHRVYSLDAALAAVNGTPSFPVTRGFQSSNPQAATPPADAKSQAAAITKLEGLVSKNWLKKAISRPPTAITGNINKRWQTQSYNRRDGAHKIYYSLHGEALANAYRKPWRPTGQHQWIGWMQPTLKLAESAMEGWVDSEAGVGYLEWTQEFVNYQNRQAEGRQHIELPSGGVVSRVTLWVNGEPREAAFDTVAKTRAAYEYVVARKRDPVLVNAIGRDKIQVECFPVPPIKDSVPGRMKIRLGITFPLPLNSLAETRLRLPRILDRNFLPVDALEHSLTLESQHPIEGLARTGAMTHGAAFEMAHNATTRSRFERAQPDTLRSLTIPRDPKAPGAFCQDTIGGGVVTSRPFNNPERQLERIAIVLDTSAPLADRLENVREIEAALPGGVGARWFTTDNKVKGAKGAQKTLPDLSGLTTEQFAGGVDAVPALKSAVRWAAGSKNGVVVWFHGSQPLAFEAVAELKTLLQLNEHKLSLHSHALNPAQQHRGDQVHCNFIADYLDVHALATAHSPTLSPTRAFEDALAATASGPAGIEWQHQRVENLDPQTPDEKLLPTRLELAKLKAHREILDALSSPSAEQQREIISAKAIAYELVTPVSGAIVMETREDYLQHNLKPPEDKAAQVAQGGTVPEPSTLLMILFGTGVLFGMRKLKAWGARR